MKLKNTADCKIYIEKIINGTDKNCQYKSSKSFRDDLLTHDIFFNIGPKHWSRTEKKKITFDDQVSWMFEDYAEDFGWKDLKYKSFVGFTYRCFMHKDADCLVTIVTDDTDELIAWFYQVD